jgi:NADH dehydrogenase/NADH:ubiquinone oxidoreductase subunit G
MLLFPISSICDQGGECDLQDITLTYGSDRSRFYEYQKRTVFDKECGSFVKMIMTRCIHCTRCVRFLSEVSDNYELGMLNRGNNSEISAYIKKSINDELSGNIIDLCPVGALTSKPFSFSARPWELNNLETVDILDSIGSSIRIDYFNNKIYRILPIYDKYINEDWITNKIRFCYDSQKIQRLVFPLMKLKDNYINLNWLDAFSIFFFNFVKYGFNFNVYNILGNFNDIDTVLNFKKFSNFLGTEVCLGNNLNINYDFRDNYFCDLSIINLESLLNLVLIGLNLRVELPLLNSRVKRLLNNKNGFKIFTFGYSEYPKVNVGNDLRSFTKFINSKNKLNINLFFNKLSFCVYNIKFLVGNVNFLFGANFFIKNNFNLFNNLNYFLQNKNLQHKVNILVSNLTYLNCIELGLNFKKYLKFENSLIFLKNVDDEIFLKKLEKAKNIFAIYSGSFFDIGAKFSNLVLPVSMFFEQVGFFYNIEGKYRKSLKVVDTTFFIYNSNELMKALYIFFKFKIHNLFFFIKFIDKFLVYFDFLNLKLNLNFWNNDLKVNFKDMAFSIKLNKNLYKNNYINSFFNTFIYNYYKSDIITKNSKNLHLASMDYLQKLYLIDK